MLRLDERSAHYDGAVVLDRVSIAIGRGERVSLIGRSGAGKSTLLKLLYAECDVDASLVPQELGLVSALSVFHNIYMGQLDSHPAWYNVANLVRPMRRQVAAVESIAETLGLSDKLFARVGELSGGQKQRTAVGRALFRGGPVFFGDEPVSSVDEQQSRAVLDAVHAGHETVVLAMHDVDLALHYSGRIVGLDGGRIVLDAPAADLARSDVEQFYQR